MRVRERKKGRAVMKNKYKRELPYVIAIDFDGCLFRDAWPDMATAKPNQRIIRKAIKAQNKGAKLILWTCRGGRKLAEAIIVCAIEGLRFDAVNENLPEWNTAFDHDSRKIGADEYWDDHCVRMGW